MEFLSDWDCFMDHGCEEGLVMFVWCFFKGSMGVLGDHHIVFILN